VDVGCGLVELTHLPWWVGRWWVFWGGGGRWGLGVVGYLGFWVGGAFGWGWWWGVGAVVVVGWVGGKKNPNKQP